MKALPGPILADIAANVLAMTLMVLIAVARLTQQEPVAPTPIALTAQPVKPVKGAEAVELLRQRLLPGGHGLCRPGRQRHNHPAGYNRSFHP
jgi:hypothetical protein